MPEVKDRPKARCEEEEKEPKKKRKKRRHGGRRILGLLMLLVLIAAIVLFFWMDGFGLLPGRGSGTENEGSPSSQGSQTGGSGKQNPPAQDGKVEIVVSEGKIRVNGVEIAESALQEYLASRHTDKTTYVLTDDHALRQTYNYVKATLDALAYTYSEAKN